MVGILGFLILLRVGLWEQVALFLVYFGIITNLGTFIYNYLSNCCSIDLITFFPLVVKFDNDGQLEWAPCVLSRVMIIRHYEGGARFLDKSTCLNIYIHPFNEVQSEDQVALSTLFAP